MQPLKDLLGPESRLTQLLHQAGHFFKIHRFQIQQAGRLPVYSDVSSYPLFRSLVMKNPSVPWRWGHNVSMPSAAPMGPGRTNFSSA